MDQQKNAVPQPQEQPTQVYRTEMTAKRKIKNRPVGFWAFVGLILLFSIPVIGLIAAVIFFFATKNANVKNFSGASMAIILTQFIATVLIVSLVLSSVLAVLLPTINQTFGTEFTSVYQVIDVASNVLQGNYSEAIEPLVPALSTVMGDEFEPFLTELSSGRYERLLHQLKNEQYGLILADLRDGKYPELKESLNDEAYAMLIRELENAANGYESPLIEMVDEILS